jgi:sugar lactone lactonase YvrE
VILEGWLMNPREKVLLLGLFTLMLIVTGCGGGPSPADIEATVDARVEATLEGDNRVPAVVTATPLPSAEVQAEETPTTSSAFVFPTATATPDAWEVFLNEVIPFCETAFTSDLVTATLETPIFAAKHHSLGWDIGYTPSHYEADDPSKVRSVVCIESSLATVFRYHGGIPANQQVWDVRIVTWPEGNAVAAKELRGSSPPSVAEAWETTGGSPSAAFEDWLQEELGLELEAPAAPSNANLINAFVHSEPFWAMDLSSDGGTVVVGTRGGIIAWDVGTGEELFTVDTANSQSQVYTLALSPDGKTLAANWEDDTFLIWDVEQRQEVHVLSYESKELPVDVAFSPDGRTLASASWDVVRLWDTKTGELLHAFAQEQDLLPPWPAAVDYSPDGGTVVMVDSEDRIWFLSTAADYEAKFVHGSSAVTSIAFSPDGRFVASGHSSGTYESPTGKIRLWDAATGERMMSSDVSGFYPVWISFSPDGGLLASGDSDGGVRIWDAQTWELVTTIEYHRDHLEVVAFSQDGKTLASASLDVVAIWDMGR